MIRLNLREVVEAIGGGVGDVVPAGTVAGVSTDSRNTAPDELFFAIVGDRFDGHDFAAAALERGAIGAVVRADRLDEMISKLARDGGHLRGTLIGVDDPLAALGRLGQYHRGLQSMHVIAVVGSNGKTTTKKMIDHVLSAQLTGRASPKSFNNAVGVPLTLLSAEAGDDYLVVEIGTNARGEIAALAQLVRPTIVVLTSIGEEHLEGLGDLSGVAAEECAVFAEMDSGFAAVNIDEPLVRSLLPQAGVVVTTFGQTDEADLRLTRVDETPPWLTFELNGRFTYRLPMPGAHNAVNALGAIAVARRLGFENDVISERLETFAPPPMRCERVAIGPITVLNDAYNANPQSMLAAAMMLAQQPADGRRIMVVGEMRELGAEVADHHRRVGVRLAQVGLDAVVLVGPAAEWMQPALTGAGGKSPTVTCCDDVSAAGQALAAAVQPGDVVLIKASRAVGLERVLEPVRQRFAAVSTG